MRSSSTFALFSAFLIAHLASASPILDVRDGSGFKITINYKGDVYIAGSKSYSNNTPGLPWPKSIFDGDNQSVTIVGVGENDDPASQGVPKEPSPITKLMFWYFGTDTKSADSNTKARRYGKCTLQLVDTEKKKMQGDAVFDLSPEDIAAAVRGNQAYYKSFVDKNVDMRCTDVDDVAQ